MDYAIMSKTGSRGINEDFVQADTSGDIKCFVVCDGLGGHGSGEVASQMAANCLTKYFRQNHDLSEVNLAAAFDSAQKAILDEQKKRHLRDGMKTTAVALLTDSTHAVWAHIGDSRLYLFQKSKVICRTLDHSVPQMLALIGEIKEKQIRNHPDRSRLLRSLGTEWSDKKYEISEIHKLSECQAFLLCTDGFWELIEEKMMCKCLKKSHNAKEWLQLMHEEILRNGRNTDMDNHSAIAVIV